MKIHPRWASDLPATRRRDVTPDRPRHHRVICSGRPAANRDESRGRIVACICDRILSRLFVTLASANHRAISDTQPGRERPPNRPWGQGPGSGGGVAHVPAALCDAVRVGKNRRRDESRIARRSVGKRSQRNQIRGRDALVESAHAGVMHAPGTPPRRGEMVPPAPSPPPPPPQWLCQALR